MPEENYLLDAIDKLTKPHTTRIIQANDAGISCINIINHEPLLLRLRRSLVGGFSPHDAGSSSARERIPMNAGALAMFDEISLQINRWYLAAFETPEHIYVEQRLRRWYAQWATSDPSEAELVRITRLVERWVDQISAFFDPHQTLELTVAIREPLWQVKKTRQYVGMRDGKKSYRVLPLLDADGEPVLIPKTDPETGQQKYRIIKRLPATCPRCGEYVAYDPKTGDQIFALILQYREEGLGTIQHAMAECRFCEHHWTGGSGVRELSYTIEQEDEAMNAAAAAQRTEEQLAARQQRIANRVTVV